MPDARSSFYRNKPKGPSDLIEIDRRVPSSSRLIPAAMVYTAFMVSRRVAVRAECDLSIPPLDQLSPNNSLAELSVSTEVSIRVMRFLRPSSGACCCESLCTLCHATLQRRGWHTIGATKIARSILKVSIAHPTDFFRTYLAATYSSRRSAILRWRLCGRGVFAFQRGIWFVPARLKGDASPGTSL